MTDTLATALVSAQKDMPHVEKNAKANYGTYATLDHIIAKTRGVLNKHGLSITQLPEVTDLGAPGLRTTITHTSGESVSALMPLLLVKQDMQSLGSALTYARRYAWAAALGISTEADDDGALATRPNGSDVERGESVPPSASPASGGASTPPAASGNFDPPADVQETLAQHQARSVPTDGGVPEEVTLSFGKFNGRKLGELVVGNAKEKGYVEWLAGDTFVPETPDRRRIKGAAQTLLSLPLTGVAVGPDSDIPFAASWV